ncbi:beta-ketoacyl synthase N-terminal-like domain-containing protein, partial [Mycobacterium colombiense]|uniref:beta-ketoacyl synthase N-terminal-like domain-containing protein n=1 Tax=Mycobacterium colombiense TaxID=339268 RepID=UPI000A73866F
MSDDGFDAERADPVVIVGMGVEAPGGIETADDYWNLLAHGREALSSSRTAQPRSVGNGP